jgi:hypothetical protein
MWKKKDETGSVKHRMLCGGKANSRHGRKRKVVRAVSSISTPSAFCLAQRSQMAHTERLKIALALSLPADLPSERQEGSLRHIPSSYTFSFNGYKYYMQ